jgi:glycosyltransferase involved in cell wall biosynthesis
MSAVVALSPTKPPRLRVAIIGDFRAENWPSMDRVAATLGRHLQRDHNTTIEADLICPSFADRFSRLSDKIKLTRNFDRLLNRLVDYPIVLRAIRDRFDVFHIVDHSYAHLVHHLPPRRTIVTCHDLDAFRCLLNPAVERRSFFFRQMTRRILRGLQRATLVAVDSECTRDALIRHKLLAPDVIKVVPLAASPVFNPYGDAEAEAPCTRLLGPPESAPVELLHVGAPIPRKRIDRVLRVVAALSKRRPVRLIRVGGQLPPELHNLAVRLGIAEAIVDLPVIADGVLAAIYRRATMLLMTSDAEGFGLPVVEAMACGLPVVATDLPIMREVAGSAAELVAPDGLDTWCEVVERMLAEREQNPPAWRRRCERGLMQAARFSWNRCAASMVELYQRLAS